MTSFESLVSLLGLPRVLARLGSARHALAKHLPAWGHAVFDAEREGVDRMLEAGEPMHRVDTDGGYMEIDTLEDASLADSWWSGKP